MARKTTKHEFKSNTLPAIVTVGPVAVLLIFLVVAPLIFVAIMSFCQTDEFYNVVYKFTTLNYAKLISTDYLKIYVQSLVIALITTVLCVLIGYPFAYVIAKSTAVEKSSCTTSPLNNATLVGIVTSTFKELP